MAYSPETKAKVTADLLAGMTVREVADKHNVSKTAAGRWLAETKNGTKRGQGGDRSDSRGGNTDTNHMGQIVRPETYEARQARMVAAVDEFFMSAVKMLRTWAEVASDVELVRNKPDAVLALGNAVLNRAERMCERIPQAEAQIEAETFND